MAYLAVAEFKSLFPHVTWGAEMDAVIAEALEFASRLVDIYTLREPGAFAVAADSARLFDGSGKRTLFIDELAASPTSVEVRADLQSPWVAVPLSDIRLHPRYPPYTRLELVEGATVGAFPAGIWRVRVTGRWGYSTSPPPEVKQAVAAQAMRWIRRGESGFRDSGVIVELGEITFTQALDPEVAAIVRHLRRPVW